MKSKKKVILAVVTLGLITFIIRYFNLADYIKLTNIARLKEIINGFGIWGPIVYLLLYISVCLFFLPGLPVTLLGGLVFGPLQGAFLSSLGSTLGAGIAFLISRYVAREMIEDKFGHTKGFKRIDQGFEKHGCKILAATRMVPILPFNLQNYLYGLTNIKLIKYLLISWFCMLPATMAYCFAACSIVKGSTSIKTTFIYLSIAAVIFGLLFYLSKFIKGQQKNVLKN